MSNLELEAIHIELKKILCFFNIVISLESGFDLTEDIISATEVYRSILMDLIRKFEDIEMNSFDKK